MKHVWILNHYAQEPGGAGGTRHFSLARHLPAHGWSATIIAASTDHAAGNQRLEESELSRVQLVEGVPFLWLKTRSYSGNGSDRVGNMLDYTRAVLSEQNLAGLEKPDVIVGSSVHPLAAWAGRRLAKRYRVPFVFEVRDLWPQTLIDMGRLTFNHPAAIALRWLERSLYRSAKRIIVLLPRAGDYIEPFGIDREKIVWIPNGVDLDLFAMPSPPALSGSFSLMYFGAHGAANDLGNLLDAMEIVGSAPGGQEIVLRMIGDGPLKASLITEARERGLRNIRFEPQVPKSAIPGIAAEADAFVICVKNLPGLYRFGISMNKIFDYMAAARPIVISVDASNDPVSEAGAGVAVPPGSPEALAAAFLELASLPSERSWQMGLAGRRYLEENHSMESLSRRLAATLDACLQ